MRFSFAGSLMSFAVALALSYIAVAQVPGADAEPNAYETQLRELRERVSNLEANGAQQTPEAEAIAKMQLESQLPDPLGSGFTGLGPAASKIYTSRSPVAIGAVAEITFQSTSGGSNRTTIANADLLFGARISQRLVFNSSFSLEDRSANRVGSSSVHYAYVDLLLAPETGLRLGNLLIPFGEANLRFEPTLYPMVNRPIAEQLVIPADWNENGVLAFYRGSNWLVQAGAVNAGDISLVNAASWLRDGRQAGVGARADGVAWVARVESLSKALPSGRPRPALGASIYGGSWAQGDASRFGRANVLMGEVHAGFNWRRLKASALYVEGQLSDADQISATLGKAIASRTQGATAILSFDLLPPAAQRAASLLGVDSSPFYHELPIFVSYELADAQKEIASGSSADRASKATIWTFGLNYLPHEQFVMKGDYAIAHDRAGFETRTVEAALGVTF